MEREQSQVEFQHPRCPFCHDVVAKGIRPEVCSGCHALHHPECWESHGACSSCGYSIAGSADPATASLKREPQGVAPVRSEDLAARVADAAERAKERGRFAATPPGFTRFASRFMFLIGLSNIFLFSGLSIWWGDSDFRIMCQFFILLGIVVLGLGVKFHLDAKRDERGGGESL